MNDIFYLELMYHPHISESKAHIFVSCPSIDLVCRRYWDDFSHNFYIVKRGKMTKTDLSNDEVAKFSDALWCEG
jgi:hypothetical protein